MREQQQQIGKERHSQDGHELERKDLGAAVLVLRPLNRGNAQIDFPVLQIEGYTLGYTGLMGLLWV